MSSSTGTRSADATHGWAAIHCLSFSTRDWTVSAAARDFRYASMTRLSSGRSSLMSAAQKPVCTICLDSFRRRLSSACAGGPWAGSCFRGGAALGGDSLDDGSFIERPDEPCWLNCPCVVTNQTTHASTARRPNIPYRMTLTPFPLAACGFRPRRGADYAQLPCSVNRKNSTSVLRALRSGYGVEAARLSVVDCAVHPT